MIAGGLTTLILIAAKTDLPFGLDPNFMGMSLSALVFVFIQNINFKTIGTRNSQ
jgi:SSS family solute:Na+ symporter